jgi:ABC-type uncharacterized transport system fused permease/ATPase subunit
MRMTLATHTNSLLTPFIALLLTPKYIEGTMTLGEVVQAAAAFVDQGAFNWITDSYGRISEWVTSANRVASVLLALDQIDGQTNAVAAADCNRFAYRAGTLTSDQIYIPLCGVGHRQAVHRRAID